jgi:hypothetical protein
MKTKIEFVNVADTICTRSYILVLKNGKAIGQIITHRKYRTHLYFEFINPETVDLKTLDGYSITTTNWREGRDKFVDVIQEQVHNHLHANRKPVTKTELKKLIKEYYM